MTRPHFGMAFVFVLLLITLFSSPSSAIGNGVEDLASSSSPKKDHYQLDPSPMGPYQTEHYAKQLHGRLMDLNLASRPNVQGVVPSRGDVEAYLNAVHSQLNTNSHQKGLLYLGQTPDKRNVHALFLKDAFRESPNVAVVSTPNVWKSLNQKIQLHTFARVSASSELDLYKKLNNDFNYSPLDALARNALPKTSQSEFDKLIGRFPR